MELGPDSYVSSVECAKEEVSLKNIIDVKEEKTCLLNRNLLKFKRNFYFQVIYLFLECCIEKNTVLK